MDKKDSLPFEIIIGVGLVIAAVAVFLVASLARTAGSVAPTLTPLPPTRPPATPTVPAIPTATAQSPSAEASVTPAPTAAALQVAPDFTLQRADGSAFTLAEQLARGPVVLVFFQVGG